jgi:hypothetical protein
MNKLARTLIACSVGIPCILLGPDLASLPAYATDLVVKGSYHTTKKEGDFTKYEKASTDVTISYNIATKIDPATKKKVFDLANSKVTFTNAGFKTVEIPITSIDGDPNTGVVKSFKFSGTEWDPDRLSTGAQDVKNDGVSGEVNVTQKTATIVSKYKDSDGKVAHYTFATQNEKPGDAKKDPKRGNPISTGSSIPAGRSIDYDATTRTLSISGDTIVGTPDPSDPILGASVNFADYQFTGFTSDGALAIFWPTSGDGLMTITNGANTFEQGDLSVLFYDVADNLFYGSPLDYTLAGMPTSSPFYDPNLATIFSSYFNSIEDVLDPSSPDFDPNAYLFLTISPDTNLDIATAGFTTSGRSGAADSQFVADAIPAPSSLALLIAGLAGLCLYRPGRTMPRA